VTSPVWTRATPLAAPVVVECQDAGRADSVFWLDPAEPLLAGHYPGFPIMPGVCLVECAHRTALAAVGDPAAELREIESTRFLSPVLPGDTVRTEVAAEAVEGGWRCRAQVFVERPSVPGRQKAAVVRLRYAAGADGLCDPALVDAALVDAALVDAALPAPGQGALDTAGVKRLLPHRFPMLLVDSVLTAVLGESVVALKSVTVNEPCYAGLPEDGADHGYPPTLLVESWCQAAALLVCLDAPNPDVLTGQVALFGGISGLRFGAAVRPGSQLVHRARPVKLLDSAAVLSGTVEVAGRTVLEVDAVTIAFREAGALRAAAAAGS
jgi:3-hydroxyacyl-[acyl-carrier-protein] dehydratase